MNALADATALLPDVRRGAPALSRALRLTRSLAHQTSAHQIGVTTAAFLFAGLLLSIFTTPDPLWWHLHFSQLGTFADFSGAVFNSTIVGTSVGVVVFAMRLRVEMKRHAGTPQLTNRRAAVVVPVLIALIGIHLSVVGFVPVNTNEFVHDRGSTGAVFAFVAVLASSKWMLRGMHRCVSRASRWVSLGLVATVAPYAGGFINLAAFELIVFSLVFFWLLLFARTVGRPAGEPAPVAASRAARQDEGDVEGLVISARTRYSHMPAARALASRPRRGVRSRRRPTGTARRLAYRGPAARQEDPEHPRSRRPQANRI